MSQPKEKYYSINRDYGPLEIKEKGSRFIAFAYPVTSSLEVKKRISLLKRQFNDASHHCFACRLINPGTDDSEDKFFYRFNDDGEPGGTAGIPIYNEIMHKEYHNILVVVVRYFGGTKLGTGGLSRAYTQAARRVLDASQKVEFFIKRMASVSFPFDFIGDMMQLIKRFSVDVASQDYTPAGIHMRLSIPVGCMDEVVQSIKDISKGKIELNMDSSCKIPG